jgi:formylglycine-generating enzyme required for sulfatase activity/serine/threonine protein kinase
MESSNISTQALSAGTRIEEFVIERVLGSGGFGITYLARDTALGRQVVIKENLPVQFCFRDPSSLTVAPRHSQSDDADNFQWSLENFSKEAAMLASLHHPGIVQVLRSFQAFGTAYFVMPHVEGVTLEDLLQSRQQEGQSFNEEELRGLLERVLAALDHLHDRGIYHRDIKPGNILITNDGIPVLIDFGSARQRLGERSMTVIESPGYTPFEQLQSRGNVGPWSDLYALAGTLVKAITGEAPPKATDRAFDDPFVPLADRAELRAAYSSSFLHCLDRALGMKPADRWQDAGEWLKALREPTVAQQQPVRQEPKITPVPAVSWMPENLERDPKFKSFSASASQPPEGHGKKTKPVPWIIAACIVLILFAIVKSVTGNKDESRTVTTADDSALQQERKRVEVAQAKEAEARAAKAQQEREALETAQREAEMKVQAKERARQIAEKKRLEEERRRQATGSKAGEEKAIKIAQGVSILFCWIPPGDFIMGSPEGELGRADDELLHRVTIRQGFWMAKTEVTQAQWRAVMGNNPSHFKGDDLPVESVSWNDICGDLARTSGFLGRANAKTPDGLRFDIPTEAEWEYACRAQSTAALNNGKALTSIKTCMNLAELGWYEGNSRNKLQAVGLKESNGWGLHDMHGNVWEWCADWYGTYPKGAATDPAGQSAGSGRVIRSGCWSLEPHKCRSGQRNSYSPEDRSNGVGFRPVLRTSIPSD